MCYMCYIEIDKHIKQNKKIKFDIFFFIFSSFFIITFIINFKNINLPYFCINFNYIFVKIFNFLNFLN